MMPTTCASYPAELLDAFLLAATETGIQQVVFLSSDLDPRPYQLPWPAGTHVYVVDHPAILDVKTAAMAAPPRPPSCEESRPMSAATGLPRWSERDSTPTGAPCGAWRAYYPSFHRMNSVDSSPTSPL